jgi:glycosyltransferase involved in cell wall biosynthesis
LTKNQKAGGQGRFRPQEARFVPDDHRRVNSIFPPTSYQVRLGIVCDYPEENWPSMDLCAQMLLKHLQAEHITSIQAIQLCPTFKWRCQKIPWVGKKRFTYNTDRLLNRFWDYPRYLSQRLADFDLYHIADHSYAHLAHVLPPERTGVYCHDIDAFRSLIEPAQEHRPKWYQAMSRRILRGLQSCAVVFYSTAEIKRQIEQYQLVEASRLVYAPYGFAPEFNINTGDASYTDQEILEQIGKAPFLLHVGSCIQRKRIDILLEVFARVRAIYPDLRLVKVSGEWTPSQQQQIAQLNIGESIIYLQDLQRSTIAALYRRASVVLLTSEAEGFGLPVIEALACGAILVVSDIPVLREVGGQGVLYCPTKDVSAWVKTLEQVLVNPNIAPAINLRLAEAEKYSWSHHTQIIAQSYLQLFSNK